MGKKLTLMILFSLSMTLLTGCIDWNPPNIVIEKENVPTGIIDLEPNILTEIKATPDVEIKIN